MLTYEEFYGINPQCKMIRASYGIEYSDEEIKATLDNFGLREGIDYDYLGSDDEVARSAAETISRGEVIGWFQGGSEIGPRALGNRSILLDIADPLSNTYANKVKRRQWWRPSAATMLE